MSQFTHDYHSIISPENLLSAWKEFKRGKRNKIDVQEFECNLMNNIFDLHRELKEKTYQHGTYHHFKISDPKPRDIHKASVRDRLLHHAIHRQLYPYFDKKFINDSYSCRNGKGTHRALNRFRLYARKVSQNHTKTVWVLKCDIRKFFASIDHNILNNILAKHIQDQDILWLLNQIISSFLHGLPLGNLTSQLLVNIYMNEFDQFVKHQLTVKHYIRYADDFVILSQDKYQLTNFVQLIVRNLRETLKLELHPNKVSIGTFASGVDFLGWTHFPVHRTLRTTTKRRMLKRVQGLEKDSPTVQSYLGLLNHGNTNKLKHLITSI